MHEQILLPTDGSDTAEHAVEQAIDVAAKYDATLHVLYIVDETEPVLNTRGSEQTLENLESEGERIVGDTIERAKERPVPSVTGAVEQGEPAQTILDYVKVNNIDLIVMGTHGRSGIDRHLLGSVAETVVRHASASVLTVRENNDAS